MNIIQVANWYIPEYGYQEYFLADAWQRAGHNVLSITGHRVYPKEAFSDISQLDSNRVVTPGEYVEDGTTVRRLSSVEFRNRIFLSRQLELIVREFRPDTVVVHGVTTPNAFRLARLKSRIDKPFRLVCDEHMLRSNSQEGLVGKMFYKSFKSFMSPWLSKVVDAFVPISQETSELLVDWCGIPENKMSIIPLGVDTNRFRISCDKRVSTREKLGLSADEILIVFSGKLVPRKRLDLLVDVTHVIMGKHPNVKLLVIGSGESSYVDAQAKRLVKYDIDSRVSWLPLQPNADLPGYFAAADIGFWPHGHSIVILEAAATGLPVVCMESKYHKERFPNFAALLFNGFDQMVNMLSLLIDDLEMRNTVGAAGKDAIEGHSWDRLAEKFLQV